MAKSLQTVFKEVFCEGLKEEGFVKIKGKQPYLVRLIGNEKDIINIITYRRGHTCKGEVDFSIWGTIVTVYQDSIAARLKESPSDITWLHHLVDFCCRPNIVEYDKKYYSKIRELLTYQEGDDNSLLTSMKNALEETKRVMLPVFNRTDNLNSCIDFTDVFGSISLLPPKYIEEEKKFDSELTEGFLFIITDNHDDLVERFGKKLEQQLKVYEQNKSKGRYVEDYEERLREDRENYRKEIVTLRDEIYNSPHIYQEALKEIERLKNDNMEVLRNYGIVI